MNKLHPARARILQERRQCWRGMTMILHDGAIGFSIVLIMLFNTVFFFLAKEGGSRSLLVIPVVGVFDFTIYRMVVWTGMVFLAPRFRARLDAEYPPPSLEEEKGLRALDTANAARARQQWP